MLVSDFGSVTCCSSSLCMFFSTWNDLVEWPWFTITVGGLGAIILLISGLLSLRKTASSLQSSRLRSTYSSLWAKVFSIQSTPFYRILLVVCHGICCLTEPLQSIRIHRFFFSGLLGTIVCTDIMKIVLSKEN